MTIVSAVVAAFGLAAQTATVKVTYDSQAPNYKKDDKIDTEKMVLLTGKDGSKYFNTMSQYVDSMTSTPEGKKKLRQVQMAAWVTQGADGSITVDKSKGNAPEKKVYTYVLKDFPKETVKVYDRWALELGQYEEPMGEISWKIESDSLRNVLGYECVMGETDYHGRHWRAWFTPEIPISDGPWKLRGLPGLILLAESDNGIRLEATGIEAAEEELKPVYSLEDYSKVDRLKALKDDEYFMNNGAAVLGARFGATVKVESKGSDEDKKPYTLSRYSFESE